MSTQQKEIVLLVDDDTHLLSGLERRLRKRFDIFTAANGDDALAYLAKGEEIAVIVCDQMMPRTDGMAVLRRFKEISPETVRIMLSGHDESTLIKDAINNAEVYRFLTKPVSLDMLAHAIEGGLQQHRVQAAEHNLIYAADENENSLTEIVADEVIKSLGDVALKLKAKAAEALRKIQDEGTIILTPLSTITGETAPLMYADFDHLARDKVRSILFALGKSDEIVAKIDILRFGRVANHTYENLFDLPDGRLIFDLHFSTLYHSRFAMMYLNICQNLMGAVRERLIFRILDIPRDLLASRVTELVNRIKPFSNAVVLDIDPVAAANRDISLGHYPYIGFDCEKWFATPQSLRPLSQNIENAKRSGSRVIAFNSDGTAQMDQIFQTLKVDLAHCLAPRNPDKP